MEAVSLKNGILPHDSRSSKAKRKRTGRPWNTKGMTIGRFGDWGGEGIGLTKRS